MFEITGRIVTIVTINERCSVIVIKKVIKGKVTLIAFETFAFWNDKMKELKLNPKDKIKATAYLNSRLYKGRWYTNAYLKQIHKCEEKPKKAKNETPLFNEPDNDDWHGHIIDEKTGEIIL